MYEFLVKDGNSYAEWYTFAMFAIQSNFNDILSRGQ